MDKELIERLAAEAGFEVIDRAAEDPAPGSAVLARVGGVRVDISEKLARFAELVAAHSAARRKSPKATGDGLAVLRLQREEQSNAPVTELGMSWRVTTTLLDAGIKTVEQARTANASGVSLPGFGRKAANELRRAIERLDAVTAG
jgi:hypothetical protein